MRKIIVAEMISLDGVMQAPGGPEEDNSNGFEFGGWVAPLSDSSGMEMLKSQLQASDYLLGRKTFQIWEPYWPVHAGNFWPSINSGTKYVLSNTVEQTDWANTAFVKTIDDIKRVKKSEGANLQVWGSAELVQLLLEHDLVDEMWLKIYPVILGSGKKLFKDGAIPATFELAENLVTAKGVIMANYTKAGPLKTGRIGG